MNRRAFIATLTGGLLSTPLGVEAQRTGTSPRLCFLSADGQGARFPALAADCLRLKADIIVVTTTPAPQAAKKVTRTIPIVMIPLGDPVSTGLVATLARPGGTSRG
jgi:ABC-type uncharacterized transport system substrate-binding protein